jgi:hypothetical protein
MMLKVLAAVAAATASQQLQPPPPDYPVDSLRFPLWTSPEREDLLTDVQLGIESDDGTASALGGRMRLGEWGYVGAQLGQRRSEAFVSTWRGRLQVAEQRGLLELSSDYRARRLRGEAGLVRRRDDEGSGWVLNLEGAYRVQPDLEVSAGLVRDSDAETRGLDERFLGSEFIRVLYQRGTLLEAQLLATSFRQRTVGGINVDGDRLDLSGVGLGLGAEWRGGLRYEWQRGPLGRELASFEADVTAPVPWLQKLVVNAGTTHRWEAKVRRYEDQLRAGLTFYARPYLHARAGQVAARTLSLQRRAAELGLNERRVFTGPELRGFRERLALSPAGSELRAELDALYAAQLAERNVPVLGFEYRLIRDETAGRVDEIYQATLGVPWPVWSVLGSGPAVPFVTLSYVHTVSDFDSGFHNAYRSVVADVELNRETSLRVRWNEPSRAPLHAALRRGPPPRFEVGLVYALGR